MKHFLTCLFIIVSSGVFAQEAIEIKVSFKPKKTYITRMDITHSAEMYFSGDSIFMAQLESSGVTMPIVMDGSSETQVTTTTGKRRKDKTIPARVVYDRMSSTMSLNGQVTTKENEQFVGSVLEGQYDEQARFTIDNIISDNMEESTRQVLVSTIESFQQQVSFPDRPLRIGDTFEQDLPLQVPIAGAKPIDMYVTSHFTLTSITREKALLDVVQTITLAMEPEEDASVLVKGSGKGVAEYDRRTETLARYESDLTMAMEMIINNMTIRADATSKVQQTVEVK